MLFYALDALLVVMTICAAVTIEGQPADILVVNVLYLITTTVYKAQIRPGRYRRLHSYSTAFILKILLWMPRQSFYGLKGPFYNPLFWTPFLFSEVITVSLVLYKYLKELFTSEAQPTLVKNIIWDNVLYFLV